MLCHAKVCQLNPAISIYQYICSFDVPLQEMQLSDRYISGLWSIKINHYEEAVKFKVLKMNKWLCLPVDSIFSM